MIVASDVCQLAMFHLQLKRVQICSTYCTPEKTFWCFRFGIQKTRWWQLNYFFKNSPRKVGEDEPNFMSMLFRWVGWVVKTHQPEKGAEARRIFSQKIMGSFQWYGGFLKWWYPTTIGFPTKNDHFGVFWGYHHLREHPYEPLKTNGVSTWMLDAFQGDFEQLLMWVRQTGWCSMPYHGTYEFQCLKWTQPFFVLGTVLGEKEMLQSSPK